MQSRGVRRRRRRRGASSSSVSMARFVAAEAIDPKLCTYVPLGKSNSHTKFRSSLILYLATRKSAITPELMAGSSPNCYHWYI
jgi:hypothetical protein